MAHEELTTSPDSGETGAVLAEYALVAVFIALVALLGVVAFGEQVAALFQGIPGLG